MKFNMNKKKWWFYSVIILFGFNSLCIGVFNFFIFDLLHILFIFYIVYILDRSDIK